MKGVNQAIIITIRVLIRNYGYEEEGACLLSELAIRETSVTTHPFSLPSSSSKSACFLDAFPG